MLLIETSYLKFSVEQSWKTKSGKWARLKQHQKTTAQGPIAWIPLMSLIKHLTKKGAPAKPSHIRYLSLCAPVNRARSSFIWGKHLSLFRKLLSWVGTFLSDNTALGETNLCKPGHGGMLQGVTAKANLSNSSFYLCWFLFLSHLSLPI